MACTRHNCSREAPPVRGISARLIATLVLALGVALLGSCRERPVPTLSATDSALQKAGALAAARSYTAAEDILRQALEADPGDHRTALGLADLYDVWKRPDAGLAALGTAMEQGAAVAQTAPLRLRFLAMAGDWAQVLTTADAQLAADPTDLEALTALTQAQLHLGACDEALVTARQATAARPADAALATTYAILSVDTARLAGLDPPLVEGILPCGQDCDRTIGLRLVRRGCWELAACLLARAATSSPEDAEIHAWLGEGYARLGLQAEAERALNRAVELDPELPQAWLLLGKHMLAAGSLDQARVALLKAHALDPENPAPCLAVAELKAQMSRYDEIERWANAALERAPTDAEIAKAVARVYLSRRLADASAAVTAVELSVRLSPDDGEAKMLLGASHLLRGNVEEALNALDDAVTLAPDLAEAHFWRARALEAVGRPRDADAARITAADLGYPAPVD